MSRPAPSDPRALLRELQNEVADQSCKHAIYQEWDEAFALIDRLRATLTAEADDDPRWTITDAGRALMAGTD